MCRVVVQIMSLIGLYSTLAFDLGCTTGIEPASADSQTALVTKRVRTPYTASLLPVGVEPTPPDFLLDHDLRLLEAAPPPGLEPGYLSLTARSTTIVVERND